LTADQKAKLKPILTKLESAETVKEADAKADLDSINGVLTADQKDAITAMTPARGGRGGAGGGGGGRPGGGAGMPQLFGPAGGGGAGMSGAPPSGMGGGRPGGMGGSAGMGGPGGGGRPDPEKPFASDAAKKSLTELVGEVSK
jgi:hypothetical protein